MQLNRGQKVDLQVSLTIAERAMLVLEALLLVADQGEATGDESSAEAEERLRALSRQFRESASEIIDDLGLVREERDLRPLLVGQIQKARDAVDGGVVRELAGYGPLDPEAEEYLRPRVADLFLLTSEMLRVAGRVRPRSI